jgi:hypothetical protein
MSGWRRLAEEYGSDGEFRRAFMHMQSARMGFVNYNSVLKAGVYRDCLYLRVVFFFRPGHGPLVIPLADISGREGGSFFGSGVSLSFRQAPEIRLKAWSVRAVEPRPSPGAGNNFLSAPPIIPCNPASM